MKILLSALQPKRATLKQAEQTSTANDNENNETLKTLMAPQSVELHLNKANVRSRCPQTNKKRKSPVKKKEAGDKIEGKRN